MTFTEELKATAQSLVSIGKGILAADESLNTENQRFQKLGILETVQMRCAYREMLFTTPGIGAYISGVLLFDETIRQTNREDMHFAIEPRRSRRLDPRQHILQTEDAIVPRGAAYPFSLARVCQLP